MGLAGVIAWGAMAGCAVGDVKLGRSQWSDLQTTSRRGENREIVLVRPFGSRREERRCGMKKNGFNMDTANVLCPEPPEVMLADILSAELAQAGFKVTHDCARAGPSTIVLTPVVYQLFVEPRLYYFTATIETDIELKVTATTRSGLRADCLFYVKGEEATSFGFDDDLRRSLESAFRQLAFSVVGAVANLADAFPSQPVVAERPDETDESADPGASVAPPAAPAVPGAAATPTTPAPPGATATPTTPAPPAVPAVPAGGAP